MLRSLILNQEEGQFIQLLGLASKPTNKLVNSHLETLLVLGQATSNTNSLDSPWLGFKGSHHLPPYNILCVYPWHLHPNNILSWDSQRGVQKLSRFELSRLWELIFPNEVQSKLVAFFKSFSTMCRTPPAHTRIGSIPDFQWSGIKLPI